MPGAVRIPVRPLTIDQQDLYAYPGEILIDPATGLIKYLIDDSTSVFNKNPGKLTVKYGDSQTLLDAGDLSTTLSFTIPVITWDDIVPENISATLINGLTANRVSISNAYGVLTSSAITATELSYLDGVSSNIQTQLDNKASSTHNHNTAYLGISATAAAATKLATARNITIGSASKSFDGSASISYTLTEIGAAAASHNHDGVYLPIDGNATSATVATTAGKLTTAIDITIGSATLAFDGSEDIIFTLSDIGAAASNHNHNTAYLGISATAAAATKLATSRTITIGNAGKSFNGTANISFTLSEIGAAAATHDHDGVYLPVAGTAASATKLATARAITIGSISKNFDGSAAISFTLSEIGAATASHNHNGVYLPISGNAASATVATTAGKLTTAVGITIGSAS